MTEANDPRLRSWVSVPKDSDFPIQNIPFGIFTTKNQKTAACTAIGEYVVNLSYLHENHFLDGLGLPGGIFDRQYLNDFFALGRKNVGKVRDRLSRLLREDQPALRDNGSAKNLAMTPLAECQMLMPVCVPNYTDFYSSEEHARNVGIMFRDPNNALLPNWKHIPVGYHGRASSIVVSGTPITRPKGQMKFPDSETPVFSPTRKLDFELELAFITCSNTLLGESITVDDAEDHIIGFVLLNDWSARDIQSWEYAPLGPFLSKNFGSTISPWIVTLDALEPFRCHGREQNPAVLPYLAFKGKKSFDIQLEVAIACDNAKPAAISKTNFKHMYWNAAQQLAHQTVNGCNIQVGDLYGSGTISGPTPDSFGSLLELTWNVQKSVAINSGTERKFLEDHDTVILRGYAEKNDVRIGFGECRGTILPSN